MGLPTSQCLKLTIHLKSAGNVILVIDEVHTLIGAGAAEGATKSDGEAGRAAHPGGKGRGGGARARDGQGRRIARENGAKSRQNCATHSEYSEIRLSSPRRRPRFPGGGSSVGPSSSSIPNALRCASDTREVLAPKRGREGSGRVRMARRRRRHSPFLCASSS